MAEPADAIVVRRRIVASPDRIYRAFTSGDELARWMSPVGSAEVEIDPRIGGALRITMVGDGRRIEHVGEFLELEPPHRLTFTWSSEYTGSVATRVTVELLGASDGRSTDLVLRHELLPERARESHAGGWGAMLDRLSETVAARDAEAIHGA